jgi:starvation-inducible DNA-binding protein
MKDAALFNTNTHEDAMKAMQTEVTAKNVNFLNHLLATEFGLFTKTLNYHWNVTGPRFHSLHTFLEDQYKDLLEIMDSVAERIRILGNTPISTVSGMNKEMTISESSGKNMSASQMLKDLLDVNVQIQESIKEVLSIDERFKKDPGTEDFIVGLLKKHEEMGWMLNSHLI